MLLFTACATNPVQTDTGSSASNRPAFVILDEQSYQQVLMEEAGMTASQAQLQAKEHFSKWKSSDANYQTVRYICFQHPDDLPECKICFGFVAVITAGDQPVWQEVTYTYSNIMTKDAYTFIPTAQSAVITGHTTVQINSDGIVEGPSAKDIQRHMVSCYTTVNLYDLSLS